MPSSDRDATEVAVSRLAAIVESSDDAIIAKDLQGSVLSWNDAAERLFGFTAAEIVGQKITKIFPADLIDEEAAILSRIGRGERIEHYETIRCHKDGRRISVSVTVSPMRDASGTIVGASKIVRDLTERDAREKRTQELQAELAHVQRLTELGMVVSALVHEVNQPLTAIGNYLSASRRLLAAGNLPGVEVALERMQDQADRTQEIVQRIRDFVNKREVRMQTEDLSRVIDDAVALIHASSRGEGLTLHVSVDPAAAFAEIDAIQVQQVLFNLLRNAIEAMQGQARRELLVTTRRIADGVVEVSVADHGPGLSDSVRETLFQPFVTTKPDGMGVGLSICRTIIEAHGGMLWADDNPTGGTVFRFTVRPPASDAT